jgi:serine/threonine protein kinase
METQPPDRIQLADEVFAAALDLPPTDRTAFVRERCADHPTLTDTVLHLLEQHERLGDFLEAPAFAPHQPPPGEFRPGELLNNGRFRLIELVGRGGMGEVYRAEDTELADIVALKVLRSRFRGEEHIDARFRGEIRLARKISHPNVCHIFDLFVEPRRTDEVLYFTMEFLEGETLARAISKGPMEPQAALALARQIAAGLDAVHRAGIIHRDLKPANILLVPGRDGGRRAVLTDFGLAKVFDGLTPSGHTLPGQIAGTPEYMAPEQFLGAALTPATDVFSFGLIIHEMLSGSRQPSGDNVVRLAMRRISEPPEPLSRTVPAVPAAWDAVLARALAPDPANRYASAADMVRALDDSVASVPPTPPAPRTAPPKPPLLRRVSRRTWIVSGAAAAGVAGLGAFLRYIEWAPTLPAKPLVMLTPTTQSIDSLDGPTAAGAIDLLLADQLQQSARIRILPKDRVQAAWQRIAGAAAPLPPKLAPAQARDIAMREGAQFVVFSNLSRVADEQVLELRLQLMGNEPAHAREEWPNAFSAPRMSDLPSAVYKSASWVRRTAGESAGDVETRSRHPEELTTSSWQALQEYTLGDEAWKASKSEVAILHLKTALDLDPSFAFAAARLADILTGMDRRDEGLPYYSNAADLIRQKNLTDRESLRIRGLFALDTGQMEEAERVFTRFALDYPEDGLPLFYKAAAVEAQGRVDRAVELSRQALTKDPRSYPFAVSYGYRLMRAGRLNEAEQQCQAAIGIHPLDGTDQLRSALAFSRLDLAGCWSSLERMRTTGSAPYQSKAWAMEACLRAEQGRWPEAGRLLDEGLACDRKAGLATHEQFTKKRLLIQTLLRQQRRREAIEMCKDALDMPLGHEDRMQTGCLSAQAGNVSLAERCVVQGLPDWPSYTHWSLRLNGELALARGEHQRALQLMKSAPPSRFECEWPEYVARAAEAVADWQTVRPLVAGLLEHSPAYWYQVDVTGPGFISYAIALAPRCRLSGAALLRGEAIRSALSQFT